MAELQLPKLVAWVRFHHLLHAYKTYNACTERCAHYCLRGDYHDGYDSRDATAPARSAIGIIRLDGDNVLDIAAKVFRSRKPLSENPCLMCFGEMLDAAGDVIDRGLRFIFARPEAIRAGT